MTEWFARAILAVTDVEASLRFYIDQLGFSSPWRFDDDGRALVAQVERQGTALILAHNWPDQVGKGLIFISLNVEPETPDALATALDELRSEFESKGVVVKNGRWGYRLLVVEDPDGNQLLFNYAADNEPGKSA
ncbi:VOC family protein [Occallatibacter riparius]|uniref:VOC family protein n=1 Tax=Occallatibacter riparius TaxID=1002689 RepID=A0A9J7BL55_9BACT|nr:VOC family protein [Occallatibacter riparius]UWZ83347.1 VOC family protein [Occallatibacter riparius]